ncbi:DUF2167 domain-containing protein [Tahibacter caeni]|uniref:DUF2167 domain-containing protein n=1 Tax=Tahibacter caeni TaxID=1453545 RepID=UPI002147E19F|nr:DUF2167 domain-containing protein [Tahibacter caeni]
MAGSRWNRWLVCVAALLLAPVLSAAAQDTPASSPAEIAANSAWANAGKALQAGPRRIELRNQATLQLPEGFGFIPTREATALMEAMGNGSDPNFIGLVVPTTQDSGGEWMVSVDYNPAGYIEDDDAKHWDADELLSNIKEGTEAGNKRRLQMGIPALEVTRWIEPPSYDGATQRLVWSAEARNKNAAPGEDNTVNYNTYVLGREGYVSLNLITTASLVESQKPVAKNLLGQVAFIDGKRYADFDSSTDKVAGYGLAALIGGVAAKKMGLFALLAAFLAKSFKLVIVGLIAAAAAIRSFFTGKKA